MKFEVRGLAPVQEEAFDIPNGTTVEVVGYAFETHLLMAVFIIDDGTHHTIPAWCLRKPARDTWPDPDADFGVVDKAIRFGQQR